ncbi:MAG: preprotein translocase subunit SecY [Lachnospiraceae bacterium]|nr:preprotein translocase subunit SecY [Lachnospiraceae bacterium]MBP5253660.1 preprotein translocase subunit SecY [Lachnospiraceae bacterium]MBP5762078.1 preprotein translocase subunit SecY [Lachnospiraceae bacterium]
MLTTLKNAMKVKEIRTRVLFTFVMLIVIRIGSCLPVPGVDRTYFARWFAEQSGGALGFFDQITGGSFMQMSILALNINPYITSSIIIQLLTIAIPKLEEMQRDGETGRKKMVAITRYVTVVLALIQSTAMAIGFGQNGLLIPFAWYNVVTCIVALTAGSAFLMWIGEQITEHGIGNGISIVLIINILSRIPQDLTSLYEQFVKGKAPATAVLASLIIIAILIGMIVMVVFLNGGERRIPVQYAKKMAGNKLVGGATSNIPLKVNTSGMIPIIFAQSLLEFPVIIVSMIPDLNPTGFWGEVLKGLSTRNWCIPGQLKYSIGLLVYILLLVFFSYFYTSITFNPLMVADNLKRQGGFIPGIRPGKPTSDYLAKVLNYLIFIGAVGLIIVSVLPYVFNGVFGANVSTSGASLIIIVSVILETLKQVESMMLVRNYKGFLKD